ncbi:MAG: hypothetical protein WC428_00510 [Candidatus Paceibacterota bacterium]
MTFFARPNLEDIQFRQEVGSTLTLSGQTRIATTSGLTLHNDSIGTLHPDLIVTAENADSHVGDVLTYDGVGKIKLLPSGAGGDPIYPAICKSPAAVSLCGICAGFVLTGKTLSCILETMLVPTLNPTIVPPSSTFTISPSDTTYEVGCQVTITGNATFSRGSICPQYCGTSPFRSGLPSSYLYTYYGISLAPVVSSSLSNSCAAPLHTIVAGANNVLAGWVAYTSGATPAYNSSGGVFSGATPAGTTAPAVQRIISGIYPYFYGKVASGGVPTGVNRPTPTCALVIAGNKIVADSLGTVSINFNSTSDDYIWFATPNVSTTKTCWFVNNLNNGAIGGAVTPGGNLFPSPATVTPVTTICWSGQAYKVYVSNYQTAANLLMELRNS